jgi:hypothetical protein
MNPNQVARQHFLSTPTLEAMLDLRLQFAAMMADTHLVSASLAGGGECGGSSGGGERGGGRGRGAAWVDDPKHPCNRCVCGGFDGVRILAYPHPTLHQASCTPPLCHPTPTPDQSYMHDPPPSTPNPTPPHPPPLNIKGS